MNKPAPIGDVALDLQRLKLFRSSLSRSSKAHAHCALSSTDRNAQCSMQKSQPFKRFGFRPKERRGYASLPPVLAGALTVCRLPAHHAVVQRNPKLPLHRHDDRCRLPALVAPRLQGLACWRNAARLAVFGTGRSGTDRRARLVHAGAPTASGAAASLRRVGSPHLRRDWAHVCCICIGTGLGPILRRFEARGILGREGAHGWPPA